MNAVDKIEGINVLGVTENAGNYVHATVTWGAGLKMSPNPGLSDEIRRDPKSAHSNRIGRAKELERIARKRGQKPDIRQALLSQAASLREQAEMIAKLIHPKNINKAGNGKARK